MFCASVKHAEMVSEALVGAGVRCAALSGEAKPEARADLIARLSSGSRDALATVNVISKGFDFRRGARPSWRAQRSPWAYFYNNADARSDLPPESPAR